MPIDPRLLGGGFTTEAALLANPGAMEARQAGLDAGFGGNWGENRFVNFQAGRSSVPQTQSAPVSAPNCGFPTNRLLPD